MCWFVFLVCFFLFPFYVLLLFARVVLEPFLDEDFDSILFLCKSRDFMAFLRCSCVHFLCLFFAIKKNTLLLFVFDFFFHF